MKIWSKAILFIALSLMTVFASVGYAQLSDSLQITGMADTIPPEAVYVTDVTTGTSAVNVNGYTLTVVNSTVDLSKSSSGKATMLVTVYNNTNIVYGYNAMIYTVGEGTFDNENIKVEPKIERRTEVAPGESLSFEVDVSYVKSGSVSNTVLNSVITYEFLPLDMIPEDEGEIAVTGVLEQFRKILNNEITNDPNTYQQLVDQMNDYANNNRHNESYIGNVSGSSTEDLVFINGKFENQLHININGVDTDVSIMIKNEPADGKTSNGNEMVIYMTTDDLVKSSNSWFSTEYAPVYAAVFAKETQEDGTVVWKQKGDMYLGSCTIKQYNGFSGNGSFDTDTWRLLNASGNRTNKTISTVMSELN